MTRDDRLGTRAGDFGKFVHALFSFRRKMLRKALAQAGYDGESLVARSGFDGQKWPEEFSPGEIFRLFEISCSE
jgi:16S rRNA A1518/A1519 N6-dimethyltransferase RsmA/KsgA/DIM1 with predicted DNA glycosylase/AP lyase activity